MFELTLRRAGATLLQCSKRVASGLTFRPG
jgi:hypothetical protein